MPCGLESEIGALAGEGNVKAPSTRAVGADYQHLLGSYEGGIPGLFAAQSQYQPMYTDLTLKDWQRIIPTLSNAMSQIAPQAGGIVRSMDPGQSGLLDTLRRQAGEGLDAGASLDPGLQRLFQQSVRGGQAARGMGFGPSDVFGESLGMTQFGEQMRERRQQFGLQTEQAGQPQSDAMLRVLLGIPAAAGQVAAGAGSQFLSPGSSANLLSLPYQGRLAAATASAANKTSLTNTSSNNSNWT